MTPKRTDLERALGVTLRDRDLLKRALTHRSFAYENGGLPTNERLEFLGDAVLSIVVTDHLYASFPDMPEGHLAKLRASVVNMNALADVARDIGVGEWLLLGRGEEFSGGRDKASILADTFEALLGAVYLDRGLGSASKVIHKFFDPLIADAATRGASLDWKTSLQELTATRMLGVPEYSVSESGPDHAKRFNATALVGGTELGSGEGRSKKEAEQRAAEAAWTALTAEEPGADEPVAATPPVATPPAAEPPVTTPSRDAPAADDPVAGLPD
ncbi:MAG TPA: ribonuclease III [Mycobacteriales bacterium]